MGKNKVATSNYLTISLYTNLQQAKTRSGYCGFVH